MNIAIVGTGYVGLVSGTCFAEMGVHVTCVDVNREKIENLQNGRIPIYEPGLDEMVMRNFREGRLSFTTHLTSVLNDVDIVFCAVGTPPDEDGSADLRYVLAVAKQFGENIQKYTLLVTKSTVPIGTAQKVKAVIQAELDKRSSSLTFDANRYARGSHDTLRESISLPARWSDGLSSAVVQRSGGHVSQGRCDGNRRRFELDQRLHHLRRRLYRRTERGQHHLCRAWRLHDCLDPHGYGRLPPLRRVPR